MNFSMFLLLCGINFATLVIVSVLMLYYLKKRERVASDVAKKLLEKEEDRLNNILDEVANISTTLYGDIEEREKRLKEILQEAQMKIEILQGLSNKTLESIPADKKNFVHDNQRRMSDNSQEKNTGMSKSKSNSLYDIIYDLADKGHSLLEIARIVDKPKGEVELILNLRHAARSLR